MLYFCPVGRRVRASLSVRDGPKGFAVHIRRASPSFYLGLIKAAAQLGGRNQPKEKKYLGSGDIHDFPLMSRFTSRVH